MFGSFAQLVIADFRDRSRRYSFLIALAFTVYLGYLFVPRAGETFYYTLTLGAYRGIYNSAWVGTVVAMSAVSMISLFGFYLIKNTVSRDEASGVGELLAASPLSKTRYILAKITSNMLYLLSLMLPLALMALLMQIMRAEDSAVDFVQLYLPFAVMVVPAICAVSAVAVFFEVTPALRRGIGNVLYFYLWIAPQALFIINKTGLDLFALEIVKSDMQAALSKALPEYQGGFSLGHMGQPMPEGSFVWQGIDWVPELLLTRLFWLGVALLFAITAIPIFNRFDPARRARKRGSGAGRLETAYREGKISRLVGKLLRPITASVSQFSFGRMYLAELRVSLVGVNIWWRVIALGLVIASIATPLEAAHAILLPFIFIWPIFIWSNLGIRERAYGVDQILFSSPKPLMRQLTATWLSGVSVALLLAGPALIRFMLAGQVDWADALLVGALFAPTLGIALGVLTKSSRFYEITFLIIWYMGPVEKVSVFDFIGAHQAALDQGMPSIYLALTGALLALTIFVRSRQLRN